MAYGNHNHAAFATFLILCRMRLHSYPHFPYFQLINYSDLLLPWHTIFSLSLRLPSPLDLSALPSRSIPRPRKSSHVPLQLAADHHSNTAHSNWNGSARILYQALSAFRIEQAL